jgi:nitrite reductase (NO-forming)
MPKMDEGRRAFLKGVGTLPLATALGVGAGTIVGRPAAAQSGATAHGQPASAGKAGAAPASAPSIVRAPTDLPAPIGARGPQHVRIHLDTVEVQGRLADGTTYRYWTFNGKVPGPMFRVRLGDTVEVSLTNDANSAMNHNVDFHAVTGPHGGGAATEAAPGETKGFAFKALKPGLYVYHCATPSVAMHISNGMFGMILVEPEGGLPKVDHEFYVMQNEIYTEQPFGTAGEASVSYDKILAETPEYYVFNGAVDALTKEHPLKAKVGETVRIFFGVGGPNKTSSFHVIGAIMDKVYDFGGLIARPLDAIQTVTVPPGGAAVAEIKFEVPGTYTMLDHAIARAERGLKGSILVEGPENLAVFNPHVTTLFNAS